MRRVLSPLLPHLFGQTAKILTRSRLTKLNGALYSSFLLFFLFPTFSQTLQTKEEVRRFRFYLGQMFFITIL